MSATGAARTAPSVAPRPGARPESRSGPRLRIVAAPAHTRARAGLVIGSAALLALALVALLVVNVSLERGAYELRHQRAEAQRLTDARDALAEQLRAAGAPQQLARRAGDLGMVPAGGVAFIQSGTGAISGTPQPGTGSGR